MKHAPQRTRSALALLALCAGLGASAHAQTAADLHNRATAAMCANCHGTDGRTVDGSAIPSLVGYLSLWTVATLFKQLTRKEGAPFRRATGQGQKHIGYEP